MLSFLFVSDFGVARFHGSRWNNLDKWVQDPISITQYFGHCALRFGGTTVPSSIVSLTPSDGKVRHGPPGYLQGSSKHNEKGMQ